MLNTLPNRVSALFADPLKTMMRDFDREFLFPPNSLSEGLQRVAPLSMWEDDQALYIDFDVPGIPLDHLDVSVQNGKLTVRGERKSSGAAPLHQERFFGKFERSILLQDWVDNNMIEAQLADGVLHLKLSKKPEAQRQKISVNYSQSNQARRIESSA